MERKYIKSLQGLRAIAAIMVFLCHFAVGGIESEGAFWALGGAFGSAAVSVFFILSGFLAQYKFESLGQEQKKEPLFRQCLRNFWQGYRRFWPLHCFMLVCYAIIVRERFAEMPALSSVRFVLNLLLLQSWGVGYDTHMSFNFPTWYLSAFMFCLLLSPAIVRAVSKPGKKKCAVLFAGLVGSQFLLAGIMSAFPYLSRIDIEGWQVVAAPSSRSVAHWILGVLPPVRVVDYALGCVLCRLFTSSGKIGKLTNQLLFFGSLLAEIALIVLDCYFGSLKIFCVAVWSIPSSGLIFSLAREEKLWKGVRLVFSNPLSVLLGNISMEFYLVHAFMLRATSYGLRLVHLDRFWLYIIAAFLLSQAAAWAIHLLSLTVRKKLAARKKGS